MYADCEIIMQHIIVCIRLGQIVISSFCVSWLIATRSFVCVCLHNPLGITQQTTHKHHCLRVFTNRRIHTDIWRWLLHFKNLYAVGAHRAAAVAHIFRTPSRSPSEDKTFPIISILIPRGRRETEKFHRAHARGLQKCTNGRVIELQITFWHLLAFAQRRGTIHHLGDQCGGALSNFLSN